MTNDTTAPERTAAMFAHASERTKGLAARQSPKAKTDLATDS